MTVSILHRATGVALSIVGLPLLVWFLAAVAAGADSYATFHWFFFEWVHAAIGYVVGLGLSLALFLHMGNGIRHLVMDTGANFELGRNKLSALAVLIGAPLVTIIFWLVIVVLK